MWKMRARSRSDRVRLAALALLFAGFLGACTPQSSPPANGVSAAEAKPTGGTTALVVFARLNADRTASGLRPLRWNSQLAELARDHTDQMATTGVFEHRDLHVIVGRGYFAAYGWLGENILVGPGSTTGAAMEQAWMASPDHRANILSPNFDSVGVAVAWSADGRVWATQDFGGPRH
jgi:uncharacterized protein YkwD